MKFHTPTSTALICIAFTLPLASLTSCATTPKPKPTEGTAPSLATPEGTEAVPSIPAEPSGPAPTPPVVGDRHLGYVVYDSAAHKVVAEQNADQLFLPASASKIVSVLAALNILGPDYHFETQTAYTGAIANGVLKGNLYLKGGGDPFLTLSKVMDLVQSLRRAGIKKIDGNFFWDEELLIPQSAINFIGDEEAPFNPALSALSVEFNQYSARWGLPANSGATLLSGKVRAEPMGLSSGWSHHQRKKRLPVRQAAQFTSQIFKTLASFEGVQLPEPQKGVLPANSIALASVQSPRVVEIAGGTLEYSNNLMAEMLQMAAARKLAGKPLSLTDSAHRILDWYKGQIKSSGAGMSANVFDRMQYESGSGLVANRVSPNHLLTLLKWSENQTFAGSSFLTLLPISGVKGSLADRLDEPSTSFRIWAKTGTFHYTNALAGFFYSQSGKKYLFVLFCSDLDKRKNYEDKFLATGLRSPAAEADAESWNAVAKERVDGLLRGWIQRL